MSDSIKEPGELKRIYERRFQAAQLDYRTRLWQTLVRHFFQQWIARDAAVLDLGCGYGEFINNVQCARRFAMDLNPRAAEHLRPEVTLIAQDCSQPWQIEPGSLDVVFTSNFFEHLPDKRALKATLLEAARALRPGGRIIAIGPNIKHVNGAYWDFWDHFLCLTEKSLAEALEVNGFHVSRVWSRFLPYTTIDQPRYPMAFVRAYLALPLAWRFLGKQFLVVAERA